MSEPINDNNGGNAKGRGAAADISRGRATRSARERYRQNARIGSVHALKRRQRRLQNSGGRTFFGSTCISCGRETTRADGWSAAHRRGWRADGLDGRKVGLLRSFSADGQRHALLLRNVVLPRLSRCLGVACLFCGCACLGLLCVCAKRACRPSFAACYPFPVCQSFCAHVVSCIFPVLSFDVGILPVVCCMRCGFLLLLRVMWSSCFSLAACKSLLSAAREERCLALPCLLPLGPLGFCAGLAGST